MRDDGIHRALIHAWYYSHTVGANTAGDRVRSLNIGPNILLLCLVLHLAEAPALLPSGAVDMGDCACSESGHELFVVLFHAKRFTSCGGTENTTHGQITQL